MSKLPCRHWYRSPRGAGWASGWDLEATSFAQDEGLCRSPLGGRRAAASGASLQRVVPTHGCARTQL